MHAGDAGQQSYKSSTATVPVSIALEQFHASVKARLFLALRLLAQLSVDSQVDLTLLIYGMRGFLSGTSLLRRLGRKQALEKFETQVRMSASLLDSVCLPGAYRRPSKLRCFSDVVGVANDHTLCWCRHSCRLLLFHVRALVNLPAQLVVRGTHMLKLQWTR